MPSKTQYSVKAEQLRLRGPAAESALTGARGFGVALDPGLPTL